MRERGLRPDYGDVLVWSFYERSDTDAFFRECASLFLAEPDDAPSGGRLERLQRGLRDERPHLLILDGLERIQAESSGTRARGELEDQSLKLLLQAVASGLGRTRALITSRYPLPELNDWAGIGYVETNLDDLSVAEARSALRGWGVSGSNDQLDAVAEQVGRHALSVAVVGSYLRHMAAGRVEAAAAFCLDAAGDDDPKAAKLARILAHYAERLPPPERDLLTRLAVFPRGVSMDLLQTLVDAGGPVAGTLTRTRGLLGRLLNSLQKRGLIFTYATDGGIHHWSAHPFIRDRFAALLNCPAETLFETIATQIGSGLDRRPQIKPTKVADLDRYEQLIEATRFAGHEQAAFDLYYFGMGNFSHLGSKLGEYVRCHRILSGFLVMSGQSESFGTGLSESDRSIGLNELALSARALGRLVEAKAIRAVNNKWLAGQDDSETRSIGLRSTGNIALALGRLPEAFELASAAMGAAQSVGATSQVKAALALRGHVAHLMGDVTSAARELVLALENEVTPRTHWGYARHLLDVGNLDLCRLIVHAGISIAKRFDLNENIATWYVLAAGIELASGGDPASFIEGIRDWTARSGESMRIVEAHVAGARYALRRGDLVGAAEEVDAGLLQANLCGYRLLQIELLTTRSKVQCAWPDLDGALESARRALDLATADDCRYAWGEAEAAQALGEAHAAKNEPRFARQAFEQAVRVRERIRHPLTS